MVRPLTDDQRRALRALADPTLAPNPLTVRERVAIEAALDWIAELEKERDEKRGTHEARH